MYTSKVLEIVEETADTKSIRFEKPNGLVYVPGHYGIFDHVVGGEIIRRSYSFSSSPTEDSMQIIVKHVVNGKMSGYLTELKPGDTLTFNAPFGKFLFDDHIRDVVFIAGGSGISVFRSMIKYIMDKKLDTKATLIYGSKSPKDIILWNWLEMINRDYHFFKLFLTVDRPDEKWRFHTGFINEDFIKEATFNQVPGRVYYLCGPPVMVNNGKLMLERLGAKEEEIRVDAWG